MLKIFLGMKAQYIKTEMEYTVNFWMMLLSGVLTRIVSMAAPFVIYSNLPDIAGWKRDEVYLILSFLFIAEGLCSVLFEGIWQLPAMVFDGKFDCILTRPVSPLFQVMSYGMGLQGISVFLVGAASLPVFLKRLGLWHLWSVAMSLFFILCGTLLCMSIYLLGNCVVFWFDAGGRTTLPYTLSQVGQYARYPLEIYPGIMRFLLLCLVPYGFICVVPVELLRGSASRLWFFALAAVSAGFFLLARAVFYRGISHYESAGM